jgi:hypothetical protein
MLTLRYTAPLFLFILCYSVHCVATATAIFVSDQGIAIATDSKIVGDGKCEKQADKIIVVQDRFAIATLGGICSDFGIKTPSGVIPVFKYEFGTWVREIESGLPNDAPFDKFCEVVNLKLSDLIPGLQAVITARQIEPIDPTERFQAFMEFVLVGYAGSPRACITHLYIDWKTKTVLEPFQSGADLSGKQCSGHFGNTKAAAYILNRESYAYKEAITLCPKALINFREWKSPITLNEAIALARASIQIEEKIDPDHVGGRVRIYEVLPSGRASEVKAQRSLVQRKEQRKDK